MKTVRTEKRIDTTRAAGFEVQLEEALAAEDTRLEIDMADTTYISSVALRVLLKAQKTVNKTGKIMIIKNVTETVMEVFDVTGFSGIFMFEE